MGTAVAAAAGRRRVVMMSCPRQSNESLRGFGDTQTGGDEVLGASHHVLCMNYILTGQADFGCTLSIPSTMAVWYQAANFVAAVALIHEALVSNKLLFALYLVSMS